MFKIDPFFAEDHFPAIGEADYADLQAKLILQIILLLPELRQEAASDIACTGDEQVQLFIGSCKEFFVKGVDCLPDISCRYDGGNIPFRRSLCDGADVYAVAAQGAKELAADPGMALHMIPDKGDDGQVRFDDEGVYLAHFDFMAEGRIDGCFCQDDIRFVDAYANGVLGGTLGDEDNIDLFVGEGFEKAFGKAGYADHTASFQA